MHARGLTLVELMVVIAVIAILVTSGLPALTHLLDRHRLRGAAAELHADLLIARMDSMRRDVPVSVSFRSGSPGESWCYAVSENDDCDCLLAQGCAVEGEPFRSASSTDFPGVALTTNFTPQAMATFHPARGTANAGTVRLSNRSGSVHVVVSSQGRVRLCSPDSPEYPPC